MRTPPIRMLPAALLLAAVALSSVAPAAADGSWLDDPRAATWNLPGADLPVAEAPETPFDPRTIARERAPETPEEEALVANGWRLYAAAQTGWGTRAVMAGSFYDGMGRPMGYQVFVFVDGAFAGTLSPEPMNSRTDGALDSFLLIGGDRVLATYRRYAPDDPLCCPSGAASVKYRVERGKGLPTLEIEAAP